MKNKDFIEERIRLIDETIKHKKSLINDRYDSEGVKQLLEQKTQFESIKQDLEILENLKDPYDEYETEDYLCTRQAYYNENLGELCFAYTIFKWDGTYREHKTPILKNPLKMKNWVEVFHAGCGTGKKELNDEYIQDYLKLKEIMKKEVVKK